MVAFLGHLVAVGTTMSIFGVFIEQAAGDFGVGMGQAGWGHTMLSLAMGLGGPWVGWILARHSVRAVMLSGAVSLAAGLVLLSRASEAWQVGALLLTLTGLGSLMVGPLPSATLVANWYVAGRGRALGIAASGTTSASLVLPPIAAWLIERYGWRDALAAIVTGACLVVVPFVWRWAIKQPGDLGQAPDGGASGPDVVLSAAPPPSSVQEILRDRNFWVLSVIFGMLFAAGLVMLLFTVPYARQLGISLQGGALLLSARAALGILGKITLGSLCDRFDKRRVLIGNITAEALFWAVILYAPNVELFVLGGLGLGFFSGALLPVKGSIMGAVFGRAGFSQAMGLMNAARLPFQFLAVPLAGYIYDATLDYASALEVFLGVFVVGLVLTAFLRIPAVEPGQESVLASAAPVRNA